MSASQKRRHVGLSKVFKPTPLLGTIHGQPRPSSQNTKPITKKVIPEPITTKKMGPSTQHPRIKKEEPALKAPPLSSDDEDDDSVQLPPKPAPRKYDVGTAVLGPRVSRSAVSKKQTRATGGKMDVVEVKSVVSDSDDDTRRADMHKTNFAPAKEKRKAPQPVPRHSPSAVDDAEDTDSPVKIKRIPRLLTNKRKRPADSREIIFNATTVRSAKTFSRKDRERLERKQGSGEPASLTSSPISPEKAFIKPSDLPVSQRSPAGKKRRAKAQVKPAPSPPRSPGTTFVMPRLLSSTKRTSPPDQKDSQTSKSGLDDSLRSSGIPLSSARSLSPLSDLESMVGDQPICPMCREEVNQELLDDFKASHPRMTITQQRKFCDLHVQKSAREAWSDKGYPKIKWDLLGRRMARHHDLLQEILGGGSSHYTKAFSAKVKSGKDKNRLKSKESLTPGYYGPRGLHVMTEKIIDKFTGLLDERALDDTLIGARGKVAYVQSVLVLEVAVRLIMEDMHVDEADARVILTESAPLGDLLNEEMEDVVQIGTLSESDIETLS